MERRDRACNYIMFLAAAVAWVVVARFVTTIPPHQTATAGLTGAGLIGLAVGLSVTPLFWLAAFARHRRIALRGSWVRAVRRGGWVGIVVALLVVLRVQEVLSLPIGLFLVAMVALAEVTLSVER
ncbi:MAG TPA: hypothetical protein VF361_00870 [Candidatus Limnocylindrales bacterium]